MAYFQKSVLGMAWTFTLRGSIRAISVLKLIIVARLLLPAQVGAFGVATIAISLLEILTETGINIFLLQEKDKINKYVDTAWIISIIRGLLISILIYATANSVASFFNIPASLPLLQLAAVIPLIRGFINPACIRLQKDLLFGREFFYRFSLSVIEVVAMIFFTLQFATIGLVMGMVTSAVIELLYSFVFISPRPRLAFKSNLAWEIFHRGKWITGFGVFDYIFTNGDNIIVGRMLGSAALGIYGNAYKLSSVPLSEVIDSFFKVTFPIFVKISDDKSRLRYAVLRTVAVMASTVSLWAAFLYFLAEPIVSLLGPNWSGAVPVVRVLAFLGVARGIAHSFNSLFLATHKQQYVTYLSFTSMLGLVLTIVPFVQVWGLVGAGYSAVFGALLSLPVAMYLARHLLK